MATVFRAPINPPSINYDANWRKQEEDYLKQLQTLARKNSNDNAVGEILRWPRADSYAQYMVWKIKPLQLIHLDLGDGWQVEDSLIRGLTLKAVRQMIQQDRALTEFFQGPNRFYDTLHLGDIVHYHNGFGQFVRCEVIENDGQKHGMLQPGDGKFLLQPIALIGPWRSHDLPSRQANGEIYYPYHVKKILTDEPFLPNASNLWEYMDEAHRAKYNIDPTVESPINLSVPEMNEEQKFNAARVRLIQEIHSLTELRDSNPDKVDYVIHEIFKMVEHSVRQGV